MHQVAAGKVAGLEAQIGAMSVYEGSLLREKNGIAAELGSVKYRSCGGSNTTRRGSARRNTDYSKCVKRSASWS